MNALRKFVRQFISIPREEPAIPELPQEIRSIMYDVLSALDMHVEEMLTVLFATGNSSQYVQFHSYGIHYAYLEMDTTRTGRNIELSVVCKTDSPFDKAASEWATLLYIHGKSSKAAPLYKISSESFFGVLVSSRETHMAPSHFGDSVLYNGMKAYEPTGIVTLRFLCDTINGNPSRVLL